MDVFSNMLEGTRQYFMGLPKQAAGETGGWAATDEPAPAQSGAPTPSAPPPSAAAAPPPPRPPSEPLEPEPHIIHKATVMREAAEKRREQPEAEDDDEASSALSPPPHIIRRPAPESAPPAPSPRPPSGAPTPGPPQPDPPSRGPTPHGATPVSRPPEHFTPARPPDPYSASRPPEPYAQRYYEASDMGRPLAPLPSPQPPPRHGSPQTYARMSSSLPTHNARLREGPTHSPPAQRYAVPPPPHNDRVPPIHHPPQSMMQQQRVPSADTRTAQYPTMPQRREESPYSRTHYERHPPVQQRKYDHQQAYPGYRPSQSTSMPVASHRVEPHHQPQYKHVPTESIGIHYPARPVERVHPSQQPYQHDSKHHHETVRRPEYPPMTRTSADTRPGYHYPPTPSTSSSRYAPTAPVPVVQSSTVPQRPMPRPAAAPKSNYEYPSSNQIPTSPARSTVKSGYPNQQARMTVSVTSIVNQMNQTKQKRESPLDLSVKTVKNSADSSTTQDDVVDSATAEIKALPLQPRSSSGSRVAPATAGYVESHKVDFAPNFSQYRERSSSHSYPAVPPAVPPVGPPAGHHPLRYNGAYEAPRPSAEPYPIESRHHTYPERSKYGVPAARADYVPRIDLTRPVDDRRPERTRDERNFIIEERKRPAGPIVSNIPEKIVMYETWSSDSRIDRMSQSAKEQHELMSRPVYSYSSHKQFEAYKNEQQRLASAAYREHHNHVNHRYPYPPDAIPRERHDYHAHHHERNPSSSSRHIIQKIPSHRNIHPHHIDPHSGMPADKNVLSILRNSLETKQTGFADPARPARQIPDLIVIDDVDDSVIEITDLTKDEVPTKSIPKPGYSQVAPNMGQHIQMPKAVDSIPADYQRLENSDIKGSENDVASRIRTKAELKVLPPSDHSMRPEMKQNETDKTKALPKSQKQHLFNQIREDMTLESVIKNEVFHTTTVAEVKSEPMNIDEIEKDAITPVKQEDDCEDLRPEDAPTPEPEDLDWANACDNFMEQLKTGVHKKKTRKRVDTCERDSENKAPKTPKTEPTDSISVNEPPLTIDPPPIVIKQEPIDEDEFGDRIESTSCLQKPEEAKLKNSEESLKKLVKTSPDKGKPLAKDKNEDEQPKISSSEPASSKKETFKPKKSLEETPEKKKGKGKKSMLENKSKDNQLICKKSLTEQYEKDKPKVKKSLNSDETKETSTLKVKKTSISKEDKDSGKVKNTSSAKDDEDPILKKVKKSSESQASNETDKEKIKKKRSATQESPQKDKNVTPKGEKNKIVKKGVKSADKSLKEKSTTKAKNKSEVIEKSSTSSVSIKQEIEDELPLTAIVKEEVESTDDDEPLIKSKILKEREMKYMLLKDLSEKSAYVKLECFDVDLNKNTRISIDSLTKEKDTKSSKAKTTRQSSKNRDKSIENHKNDTKNEDSSSNSEDEELNVSSRLRTRKNTKTEDSKSTTNVTKSPVKSTPKKQEVSPSISATPVRKPGFGDGSDFHPGWEEELYRYKRSLRMPTRLIAIPRGRSGGPFVRGSGATFNRGSTSLPDLDPAPLSPAPSSAPSAATDDLYSRRPDKLTVDSDLESNSSYSATNRLQYDSEASTSTIFSTKPKKKGSSIVDVLIQKCGKHESKKKSKDKEKEDKTPKIIPKSTNPNELLPTPSLGLVKNGGKGLSAKKEKLMEDIFYLGAFRKETVTAFRNAFINNTDGLIGATEEFAPVVLKSRTRTESRVLKKRATIKEVFGDERPASAPPTSCLDEEEEVQESEATTEPVGEIKKEPESKPKLKSKKIIKDKLKRRSSSIRDGLRSTKSLLRNDAKGRLMRLKKRNSLMKSLASKRMKDLTGNKIKKERTEDPNENDKAKPEATIPGTVEGTKRRLKRLFGRRKFSSGFDYIRKKKKIIRRDDAPAAKPIRRPAVKQSPESENDIQKEIKGWFINKSVGETHLHRAARLGYTDCVAYCLEKLEAEPSARDNAGFTPLHVAAAKGHVRIARLLLQYGANVSAAANGGIRPLHEACENCHVEVIRLLLSYGADPLLGTYSGQTPEELTEGPAARFLRLHISDVQGHAIEPWRFPPPADIIDREELGCDPLSSPPPGSPPPPDQTLEFQCTQAPLPPFYSFRSANGQPTDGLWCLLQDITNVLQIKSKESLLKQIHCGSGSPKELLREIRTQEFLERAQCHQLLGAGEKVNVRASKVSLVRVTDKLRQLLKIETILVS